MMMEGKWWYSYTHLDIYVGCLDDVVVKIGSHHGGVE